MADIFSVMSSLELTATDVQEAEVFAQQFLEAKFPTVDFRQGTGVRDLVIRPNAVLLATVKKYIEVYFDSASLGSVTNDTPAEVVDAILSNFFIERQTGSLAVVQARLYFLFQNGTPTNVQIPVSAFFSTDNTRLFYPSAPVFAQVLKDGDTAIAGNTYLNYDESEELWYVDIPLSSATADETFNDQTTGDLLYFSIFNPYFVKGSILYMTSTAVAEETNVDLVNRSYSAISTRNLINDPSITSRLTDVFNYIKHQRVVGMGDPDMWRDLVDVNGVNDTITGIPDRFKIHVGGCVDIFTSTDFRTNVVQYITDKNGMIELTGPIFDIYRSPVSGGTAADDIPAGVGYAQSYPTSTNYVNRVPVDPSKDIGLSANQVIRLEFGLTYPLKKVSFVVRKFLGLEDMQTFIKDPQNRVVCADGLVRAFEPVLISIEAQSYTAVDANLVANARTAIEAYFDQTPDSGTIYVSDLYKMIVATGLSEIKSPITVTATAVAKDLVKTVTDVTDSITATSTQRFVLDVLTVEKNT
jgi:hypothetical protein